MDGDRLRRLVTAVVVGGTAIVAAAIAGDPLPQDAAPPAAPRPDVAEQALAARQRAAVARLDAAEAHLRAVAAGAAAVPAAPVVSVAPPSTPAVVASGSS